MSRKDLIFKQTKYRSGLEYDNAVYLDSNHMPFKYEKVKFNYVTPATKHVYTPDFQVGNFFVECKGAGDPRYSLDNECRKKMLQVKKDNPDVEFRFVFSDCNYPINKGSKTTYADWCNKHGFKYAQAFIPLAWVGEEQAKQGLGKPLSFNLEDDEEWLDE